MIKIVSIAAAIFVIATSATAMTSGPVYYQDGMIAKIAWGCGPGRTRVHGICVARTTIRQTRRCLRWHGGICAHYY
jgi:hypothetical protein